MKRICFPPSAFHFLLGAWVFLPDPPRGAQGDKGMRRVPRNSNFRIRDNSLKAPVLVGRIHKRQCMRYP